MARRLQLLVTINERSETTRIASPMTYRRRATTAEWTARLLPFVQLAFALPVIVVVAYWAKSAVGIDLLPGPSPLHDLLFWR